MEFINRALVATTGRRFYYNSIIVKRKLTRLVKKRANNKYLFILSPPFCGSTLLNEVISSSDYVSVNFELGTREGQRLPKVEDVMFVKNRWDSSVDFDWKFIKNEWLKYWDITKPVLLEKSPANSARAKSIMKHFAPAYFIVFYRNPYAHCESLMRRENYSPEDAAKFAIKCLKYQKLNLETLPQENILELSYRELTENPERSINKISNFLPELGDINVNQEFNAHNYKNEKMKIMNLNKEKIRKLKDHEIQRINTVFHKAKDILSHFKYEMIESVHV